METFLKIIPPCFRDSPSKPDLTLYDCLVGTTEGSEGVLPYWTNLLFLLGAIISFVYILYGAFMMMTAFGDEAKYTEGKKTVLYAIIGFFISMIAGLIVNAFVGFLGGQGLS